MYKFYEGLNTDIKRIRNQVFVKEQNFTNEFDETDDNCIHLLYFDEKKAVGTSRIFNTKEDTTNYHIGRVAVLKNYRSYGVGRRMVQILEEKAKELGGETIELSAQVSVKEFYEKLGYEVIGEEYQDEWCPHVDMVKEI